MGWPKILALTLAAASGLAVIGLRAVPVPHVFEGLQGERTAVPNTTFVEEGGAEVTLAAFRGKVVVLNLWASWCVPCMKEMPSLDRLAARLPTDSFAVVAVNEDKGGAAVAKPVLERLGIRSLPFYGDPNARLAHDLGARGFPTTILIGRDGDLLGKREGAVEWDKEDVVSYLLSLHR